jgi:hypothetical protein
VRRILITGMSGTGKSSVIRALAARGLKAIDTDWNPEWERVGANGDEWVWREDRIRLLLAEEDAEALFVSACVSNQGKFYDHFDQGHSPQRAGVGHRPTAGESNRQPLWEAAGRDRRCAAQQGDRRATVAKGCIRRNRYKRFPVRGGIQGSGNIDTASRNGRGLMQRV